MTDAKTYPIDIDTPREAGKQIILDHLFGLTRGAKMKALVKSLTGIEVVRIYASPKVRKIAGRVRSWLTQMKGDGVLGFTGCSGYRNITSESRAEAKRREAEAKRREAEDDRVESQAKADRAVLADRLGSEVKFRTYSNNVLLTPAQLRQVVEW